MGVSGPLARPPFHKSDPSITSVGISPAWEEESPGRNPKSLKSRKSPRTLGPQKSEKSLGEGPRSLEEPVLGLFRDFSDPPRDFFQTFGARGSEDFFETFGVSARRLLLPGRGDPNTSVPTRCIVKGEAQKNPLL